MIFMVEGAGVAIAELPRMARARVEAEARSLLRGVGTGGPQWRGVWRRPEPASMRGPLR